MSFFYYYNIIFLNNINMFCIYLYIIIYNKLYQKSIFYLDKNMNFCNYNDLIIIKKYTCL